jgi:DNA mismatch repair protein MutS2
MENWSSDILEYESLRQLVGRFVSSQAAHELLQQMEPLTDAAAIGEEQADNAETMRLLAEGERAEADAPRLNFQNLPDVREALGRLRIEGSVLEGLEILALLTTLDRAREARLVLHNRQDLPRLAALAQRIGDFRELLRDLEGRILPDGSLDDHASAALARLRKDRVRQKAAIEESLDRFVRQHRDDGLLQETFVSVRNDRFVVPVVSGQRRRVDGVIHGSSGSGQTIFVEPLETIPLNNELARISEEELREIHRILREMTRRLHDRYAEIAEACAMLARLDLLHARAVFAREFACCVPQLGESLKLVHARHPLLADILRRHRRKPVPLDLELDTHRRTLMISGPNTGGKTVAMKTLGLLALMAQSGLPVPADEAVLPLFDRVLADIGDQQSIAEGLSGFSSHIRHVGELLEQGSHDSLILLDELGRATDPEEGGALGVALLERFRLHGGWLVVSTHLLPMKVWAAQRNDVVNASMGFDENTLEPTYVLRVGAPGKSAALDIASRLGLDPALIARAREVMSRSERDIASFLADLHQRIEELEAQRKDLVKREVDMATAERGRVAEWERREQKRAAEVERETARLIARFEEEARAAMDDVRQATESRKAADKAQVRTSKVRRELQQDLQKLLRPEVEAPRAKISEGARVRLNNVREPARVLRLLKDDRIEVQAGFLKMTIDRGDVKEVLDANVPVRTLPTNVSFQGGPSWDTVTSEINVIGQNALEASDEVERFLDKASLASVHRVRIVHGHGYGVLKKAVAKLLTDNPHVEKFYEASPGEGGSGATIAELR